jgi:hypothetical protein
MMVQQSGSHSTARGSKCPRLGIHLQGASKKKKNELNDGTTKIKIRGLKSLQEKKAHSQEGRQVHFLESKD